MSDDTQTNPSDSFIPRNRFGRNVSVILSPLVALFLGKVIGQIVFAILNFPTWPGSLLGLAAGSAIAVYVVNRSLIVNEAVQAFVTINPLASLFGRENALVSYGPGTQLCYWWEQRLAGNNIALNAAAQTIKSRVQTTNGILDIEGSSRLRPDILRLPQFLSGVASAPGELTGLIQDEINSWLGGTTIEEGLGKGKQKELNEHLKAKFVTNDHPLEVRYGVKIDDVTINQILPSADVQQTMSSLAESAAIDLIVARSFGKASARALQLAIKKNEISSEDVTRRRTQTIAMSGNLQGMNLNDYNVNVSGFKDIPPEVVAAFGSVVRGTNDFRKGLPKTAASKLAASAEKGTASK